MPQTHKKKNNGTKNLSLHASSTSTRREMTICLKCTPPLNRGHQSQDKHVADGCVLFSFSSQNILIFVALALENGTVRVSVDSAVHDR